MEHNSQMQTILKRAALIGGGAVLLFSIYFSYDGFDQSVTGGNDGYSGIAIILGFGLAMVFTIVEFIFNSGFGKLNMTLIVCGILAYVYSIAMNHSGIIHLLHMNDEFTAWVLASAMDILPESMFAWALGDSLKGDLFGNIIKSIGSVFGIAPKQVSQGHTQPNKPYVPASSKKGRGRSFYENQRVVGKSKSGFQTLMKDLENDDEQNYHPVGVSKPNGERPVNRFFE